MRNLTHKILETRSSGKYYGTNLKPELPKYAQLFIARLSSSAQNRKKL